MFYSVKKSEKFVSFEKIKRWTKRETNTGSMSRTILLSNFRFVKRSLKMASDGVESKKAKIARKIIFVRHGESEWNKMNQFCGWFDADLTQQGVDEAVAGGKAIKDAGYKFDMAFTSVLKRANKTLDKVLDISEQPECPITKSWRLNERHYGGLTGLNKKDTVEKYGADQVQIWRRSYDTPPPTMENDHPYYKSIVEDSIYEGQITNPEDFPKAESLKLTIERTMPFWKSHIAKALDDGKFPIVAAHGNSLRGIVCHLDEMTNEQIMLLNLPTGIPFLYELDENNMPISKEPGFTGQFLGDKETVDAAIEKVKNQTAAAKK